jgi:hypothetical protein
MSKVEQQGFLTIAQNNSTTDYLRMAYTQALSVKLTMPNSKYAVLVDDATFDLIEDKHKQVFDYIIKLPVDEAVDQEWKLNNEWQVFALSPFKETIKLESDLLFTRSIDHWWAIFRLRNIVLSLGCKDYQGNTATSRRYRQVFDDNELPDIYTGLMYFRYSQEAYTFFEIAAACFKHWDSIVPQLKKYSEHQPTTDLVYAIVCQHLGIENYTLPGCDFINFTHMKNSINQWPEATPWSKLVISEVDAPMIRINGINQYHPFHYQDKEWLTDDIIRKFEQAWLKN